MFTELASLIASGKGIPSFLFIAKKGSDVEFYFSFVKYGDMRYNGFITFILCNILCRSSIVYILVRSVYGAYFKTILPRCQMIVSFRFLQRSQVTCHLFYSRREKAFKCQHSSEHKEYSVLLMFTLEYSLQRDVTTHSESESHTLPFKRSSGRLLIPEHL